MILSRYVKKQALFAITGAVIGLWFLKILFEYLAELQELNDHYNYLDALRFIAYNAPSDLLAYMPFGTLLGAVVGLGLLANTSELTVIQAAGISRFKIVGWVMQPAIIFVIIGLLLGQFVLPITNQLSRQVKHDQPLLSSAISGYWDKQANRIINVDYANTQGELKNIKVWQLDNNAHIQQVLQADTGRFVSQNAANNLSDNTANNMSNKSSGWQLQQIKQLTIAADGSSQLTTVPTMTVQLPIEPSAIYLLTRRPDDMSVTELWQHQQLLAKDKRRSLEHEVAFWKKLLSPFAMLSLVLVACSFVFGSLRNQSLGYRIVIALLFCLIFSYMQDLVGFVSLSTGFSPFLMVLLPIIGSAALGVYLIKNKN